MPERCSACGSHPSTQGHAADCNRRRLWDVKTYPVLVHDTDICRDCGEPYGRGGFSTRCLRRHWRWQNLPCARCSGAINYAVPYKDPETNVVNPKSLVVGSMIPPAEGRRRRWGLELINALWNKQPVHAACARARS